MNQDTTTYRRAPYFRVLSCDRRGFTYRASDAHLYEQQGLLPRRQLAQVHRCKSTDRRSADRVVQGIDVRDRIPSVGGIYDDGANQGSERTGRNASQQES